MQRIALNISKYAASRLNGTQLTSNSMCLYSHGKVKTEYLFSRIVLENKIISLVVKFVLVKYSKRSVKFKN